MTWNNSPLLLFSFYLAYDTRQITRCVEILRVSWCIRYIFPISHNNFIFYFSSILFQLFRTVLFRFFFFFQIRPARILIFFFQCIFLCLQMHITVNGTVLNTKTRLNERSCRLWRTVDDVQDQTLLIWNCCYILLYLSYGLFIFFLFSFACSLLLQRFAFVRLRV